VAIACFFDDAWTCLTLHGLGLVCIVLFADSYDFDTEADDRRIFVRPQRTEIGRMEVAKQRLAKAGFQFYELPDSEESDDDTWPLKEKRDHASDLVCCLSIHLNQRLFLFIDFFFSAELFGTIRSTAGLGH
jgi:hypothetical protein